MCGINGIFAYAAAAPAPSEAEMAATRDRMRTRGPDGAGAWWSEDRRCVLGHRRLSIIDLSERAAQPMASEKDDHIVAFNGEIYNYPELKAELEAQGVRFRSSSDTEVLLHLYRRDGQAMASRLRGMFAFAIWDARRKGLLLVRDPYGIKPLYTSEAGGVLRFASQVKAILAGGGVSRDLDPAGAVGFHLMGYVPEPFTLYSAIQPFPPGHTQWVDGQGARPPIAYANIAAELAEGARRPADAADIAQVVRAGVLDSVRAHLIADVEVGCFLSAGVDSGALLGLMRDAGQPVSQAITLGFKEFAGGDEDETVLAARVAAHYGARHRVRMVDEAEFREDLPAIIDAMDQPSMDGVNTWFVAKAAREAGLKVALSGLGADELLGGYASFRDIPRWVAKLAPAAAVPGLGVLARRIGAAIAPGIAARKPKALGLLEYGGSFEGAYLLRRALHMPFEIQGFFEPSFLAQGVQRLAILSRFTDTMQPDPMYASARVSALESSNYMRNQLLRDADWAGMAHSLEIRTPFVDFELLKRLAPILPGLKDNAGKAALAAAPQRALPAEIVNRAKTGFGTPTARWLSAISGEEAAQTKGLASRQWARWVYQQQTSSNRSAYV